MTESSDKSESRELSLDKVLAEALHDNQFVSLQDTNHASLLVKEGLRRAIPALARVGVKHLFIEGPAGWLRSDQRIFDSFQKGNVNASEVLEYYDRNPPTMWTESEYESFLYAVERSKLLETCKQYGIKVWNSDIDQSLIDQFKMLLRNPEMQATMRMVESVSEANPDECEVFNLSDASISPELERQLITDFLPWLVEKRSSINQDVVDFMYRRARNEAGEPEKAAFFWGAGHSNNFISGQDMDELMSRKNGEPKEVTNIAIYPSRKSEACSGDEGIANVLGAPRGNDSRYMFYVDEEVVVTNPKYNEQPSFEDIEAFKSYAKETFTPGDLVASLHKISVGPERK